jgi:uncharacterized SAM-binding protein YcdF (DUF218 family)
VAQKRAEAAASLVEAGKTDMVVFSGGKIAETDVSEAVYMKKIFQKKTTKSPEIITEEGSHNTYENIKNSRQKIPEAKSVIIVSDKFHLARAFLVAKKQGFETVYWSSPDSDYYSKNELETYYIREMVAMLNYLPKLVFD